MTEMELTFESGESSLDVRRFKITEGISTLWAASIVARSPDPSLDLAAITGKRASLRIATGLSRSALGGHRRFAGICVGASQIEVEPTGLSTYRIEVRPLLWKLTQRRNHRIFQRASVPEIAETLLAEWAIPRDLAIDRSAYPKLECRVQYGESDYAFVARLLEEAGIAFTFTDDADTRLLISDALSSGAPRGGRPIPFLDASMEGRDREVVMAVRAWEEVRPGAYGIHDHDFRAPLRALYGEATHAPSPEDRYEETHYVPSGGLIETPGKGGVESPAADDRGTFRRDPKALAGRAERSLEALRADKQAVALCTNAVDLRAGEVFLIEGHPRPRLASPLLLVAQTITGAAGEEWLADARAVFTDVPYRPPRATPKPRARGVESAIVVGPPGQEIHTDEFGRVRVQFPWDRRGRRDDGSSPWIRVSQGWAGPGYGMLALPRIGQEVLIAFLEGDPDQPVVVGRVHDVTSPVPYKLPEHKTRSTWKSDSSPSGDGFNEILFEDLKNEELVYLQAQKKMRRLVKHDEVATIVRHREKTVEVSEEDTTRKDRIEVTQGARKETISKNRVNAVTGTLRRRVEKDDTTQIDGDGVTKVDKDLHVIVEGDRKELVEMDEHIHVLGSRSESVGGRSLLVGGSVHEKMGRHFALEAADEVHLTAVTNLVAEGVDVTLKGAGGFVRIDASGVTIVGTLVHINNGGSAGSAKSAGPSAPDDARAAHVQITHTIRAEWVTTTAYCGDTAAMRVTVTPAPANGPATVDVILSSTGATLATISTTMTGGVINAAWVTKAPTANWRTDIIEFWVTIPSISAGARSTNTFTFRQRPTTGWTLTNRTMPTPLGGLFLPPVDRHDTALEADRVHYSLKLRLTGAPLPPARQANAKNLIETAWNDGFAPATRRFHRTLCGRGRSCDCQFDCCKAGFRLDVNFVTSGEHVVVTVLIPPDPTNPPASSMGNEGFWYEPPLDEPSVYSHECGHVMGQYDEYPTGANDPSGVQPANSPVPNIMATRLNTTPLNRHYRFQLEFLNANTAGDVYEIIPP